MKKTYRMSVKNHGDYYSNLLIAPNGIVCRHKLEQIFGPLPERIIAVVSNRPFKEAIQVRAVPALKFWVISHPSIGDSTTLTNAADAILNKVLDRTKGEQTLFISVKGVE